MSELKAGSWKIGRAKRSDLQDVREFYERQGYTGGAQEEDRTYVAVDSEGRIVAAVRLCAEEGHLVLRGMYVDEDCRGLGLGRYVLKHLDREIGTEVCWCLPYAHLVEFYSLIGFRIADRGDLPDFLSERIGGYQASGSDIVVMRRAPTDDRDR